MNFASSSSSTSDLRTTNPPSTTKYGYVDTHAHLEMILEKLDTKYEHWIESVREKESEKLFVRVDF